MYKLMLFSMLSGKFTCFRKGEGERERKKDKE